MCGMFKKSAFITVGAIVALYVLSFTTAGSYVSTWWKKASICAHNQVPMEFEIDRLRTLVGGLRGEFDRNRNVVANLQQKAEDQEKTVAGLKKELASQEKDIQTLAASLKDSGSMVAFNGRQYKKDVADVTLANLVRRAQATESRLKNNEKILEENRRAAQEGELKLASIGSQESELLATIEKLQGDLAELRRVQTESKVQVDDSRLAAIKKDISTLERRMKVEQKELDLEKKHGIVVEETKPEPKANGADLADAFLNRNSK